MKPFLSFLALVATSGPWAIAAEPVAATARVASGPYYVGQAIEVRVEIGEPGAPGTATIEPPVVAGAEVWAIDPEGGSTPRVVVIPRRPGPLDLPSIRAKRGDRAGATRPSRLKVLGVPAAGRSSAFLGGVGAFEVRAEVEPSTLRAGQTFEYRLQVKGPAAWGSFRRPDLAAWASLNPGFRVEALEPSEVRAGANPPSRTFRYRLRPTRGGRATLPPVGVAAFDPGRMAFATRYTAGLPVVVEEVARFNPALLGDDGSNSDRSRLILGLTGAGLALGLAGILAGAGLIRRNRRKPRRVDPVRLASELASELDPEADGPGAARAITDGFATWLGRVGGRPEGVLTPPEAAEGVERLTSDASLAARTRRLIERSDRARFGGGGEAAPALVAAAREIFEALGRAMAERRAEQAKPREAVETAGSRGTGGRELPPAVNLREASANRRTNSGSGVRG